MPSRDVWSSEGAQHLVDLLGSALSLLMLLEPGPDPVYFSSPWMSDFPLLANRYRQFASLFPDDDERASLRFTNYLVQLGQLRPVRLITAPTDTSRAFLRSLSLLAGGDPRVRLEARLTAPEYHEKGVLAPTFYLEGSMNITYNGVFVKDEKVAFHAAGDPATDAKIARAYLEFNRRWSLLAPATGAGRNGDD